MIQDQHCAVEIPHECRDSQKTWSATSPQQSNSQACCVAAQGCGNSDTFSPQAWRGDEGARRVLPAVECVATTLRPGETAALR